MPNTTSTEPAGQAPLRLGPLLHPAEFSRMLLALSAVVISIGVYVAFLLALGGPIVLAVVTGVVLFLVGSLWLSLQLFRARLLGQSVRVSDDSLPEIQCPGVGLLDARASPDGSRWP
ncbi:MAG: hypothetical protein QOF67_262 [Mycobacterium sp.]|nr:hypothetical protein [Mycobacterium sp.]